VYERIDTDKLVCNLLENHRISDSQDTLGPTALHHIILAIADTNVLCMQDYIGHEVVKILVRGHSDYNLKDKDGLTPLALAENYLRTARISDSARGALNAVVEVLENAHMWTMDQDEIRRFAAENEASMSLGRDLIPPDDLDYSDGYEDMDEDGENEQQSDDDDDDEEEKEDW